MAFAKGEWQLKHLNWIERILRFFRAFSSTHAKTVIKEFETAKCKISFNPTTNKPDLKKTISDLWQAARSPSQPPNTPPESQETETPQLPKKKEEDSSSPSPVQQENPSSHKPKTTKPEPPEVDAKKNFYEKFNREMLQKKPSPENIKKILNSQSSLSDFTDVLYCLFLAYHRESDPERKTQWKEVILLSLTKGAKAKKDSDPTPLARALQSNDKELVDLLFAKGEEVAGPVQGYSADGPPPISRLRKEQFSEKEYIEILKKFIEKDVNPFAEYNVGTVSAPVQSAHFLDAFDFFSRKSKVTDPEAISIWDKVTNLMVDKKYAPEDFLEKACEYLEAGAIQHILQNSSKEEIDDDVWSDCTRPFLRELGKKESTAWPKDWEKALVLLLGCPLAHEREQKERFSTILSSPTPIKKFALSSVDQWFHVDGKEAGEHMDAHAKKHPSYSLNPLAAVLEDTDLSQKEKGEIVQELIQKGAKVGVFAYPRKKPTLNSIEPFPLLEWLINRNLLGGSEFRQFVIKAIQKEKPTLSLTTLETILEKYALATTKDAKEGWDRLLRVAIEECAIDFHYLSTDNDFCNTLNSSIEKIRQHSPGKLSGTLQLLSQTLLVIEYRKNLEKVNHSDVAATIKRYAEPLPKKQVSLDQFMQFKEHIKEAIENSNPLPLTTLKDLLQKCAEATTSEEKARWDSLLREAIEKSSIDFLPFLNFSNVKFIDELEPFIDAIQTNSSKRLSSGSLNLLSAMFFEMEMYKPIVNKKSFYFY